MYVTLVIIIFACALKITCFNLHVKISSSNIIIIAIMCKRTGGK